MIDGGCRSGPAAENTQRLAAEKAELPTLLPTQFGIHAVTPRIPDLASGVAGLSRTNAFGPESS